MFLVTDTYSYVTLLHWVIGLLMGFSTNWKGTHDLYAYIQLYEFNNIVSSVGSSYFDTLYSIFLSLFWKSDCLWKSPS